MNNKKPKLSKYYIATAKRLLKYVTETYKAVSYTHLTLPTNSLV